MTAAHRKPRGDEDSFDTADFMDNIGSLPQWRPGTDDALHGRMAMLGQQAMDILVMIGSFLFIAAVALTSF
jgi:hypothetical protein